MLAVTIPVFLSIGAIYALIPVIVIVILIAAAAGLRGVDSIFGMFGFAAIASFVGGKGAIGGGKAGRGISGAKYKADTKTLKGAAAKIGATAREERIKKQYGEFSKTGELKSPGYIATTAEKILKEQKGPELNTLAASWKGHDYQRNPGMARMAVAQEVTKRYRRGLRAEKLTQKNLSIAQRMAGKVANAGGAGVETLYRHGLSSDAAVAVEKKLYPEMQKHTEELKKIRNEIYKKANENLEAVFGTGAAYTATSKFDNWSERIVGKRIISGIVTPATPKGPGTVTDEPEAATLWAAYAKMWKNEVGKATKFEWEARSRPAPPPPPPGT